MDRGKKRYMLLYFQVLSIQFFDNVLSCPASIPTISYVSTCPKNQEEWEKAAQVKNCESIAAIQNCTKERSKFQYHCLLNQWKNATLEVCAPIFYLQGYCAEYNAQIKQVAEIYDKGFECLEFPDAQKCPPRYPSNEAYKYQRCYKYKNETLKLIETLQGKKLSSKDNSMIALYFIIVVSLLFGLIASVFVMLRKGVCERLFIKEEKKEENEEGGEGNEGTKLLSPDQNKADVHIENRKHEGKKPVTAEEKRNTDVQKAKNEENKFAPAEERNAIDVGIEKKKPDTAEEKRNTDIQKAKNEENKFAPAEEKNVIEKAKNKEKNFPMAEENNDTEKKEDEKEDDEEEGEENEETKPLSPDKNKAGKRPLKSKRAPVPPIFEPTKTVAEKSSDAVIKTDDGSFLSSEKFRTKKTRAPDPPSQSINI